MKKKCFSQIPSLTPFKVTKQPLNLSHISDFPPFCFYQNQNIQNSVTSASTTEKMKTNQNTDFLLESIRRNHIKTRLSEN